MIDLRNYALLGLGAVLVAALAWGGTQSIRLADERADHMRTKSAHSEVMRLAANARAKESEAHRSEEARREAAKEKEIQHAQEQRRAALAAAARADRAADGLRDQLATFVSDARARAAAEDSSPAQRGETTGAPIVVLADLFGRSDAVAGELAKAVDAAHGAGLSCERSYQSLTPDPP